MGFFWQGLPPYMIPWSQALLGTHACAVETGTFEGDTALLLADSFGRCLTIERSAALAGRARQRFAGDGRISVIEGPSQDCLPDAVPDPEVPTFFWLDAHGMYDYEGNDPEENPLLVELDAIFRKRGQSDTVIAIDDAQGMGVHPGWPSIAAITSSMTEHGYASVIIDDVIVAVPVQMRPDFNSLYQNSRIVDVGALFHVWPRIKNAVDWRARLDSLVESVRRIRRV